MTVPPLPQVVSSAVVRRMPAQALACRCGWLDRMNADLLLGLIGNLISDPQLLTGEYFFQDIGKNFTGFQTYSSNGCRPPGWPTACGFTHWLHWTSVAGLLPYHQLSNSKSFPALLGFCPWGHC